MEADSRADSSAAAASSPSEEAPPSLSCLPPELLRAIASHLLPPSLLSAPAFHWSAAVQFALAAAPLHTAFGEALCDAVPALALIEPKQEEEVHGCWPALVAALRGPDSGRWLPLRTLRAVRPAHAGMLVPVQEAPRVSGATLVALDRTRLVLFGGRCSHSGETMGDTHLATVSFYPRGLAQWDR